jgi:hypothetical protein
VHQRGGDHDKCQASRGHRGEDLEDAQRGRKDEAEGADGLDDTDECDLGGSVVLGPLVTVGNEFLARLEDLGCAGREERGGEDGGDDPEGDVHRGLFLSTRSAMAGRSTIGASFGGVPVTDHDDPAVRNVRRRATPGSQAGSPVRLTDKGYSDQGKAGGMNTRSEDGPSQPDAAPGGVLPGR